MNPTTKVHCRGLVVLGLAVLVCYGLVGGCGRKNEQGSTMTPREGMVTGGDRKGLWQEIDRLQARIRTEPTNPELRRALVAIAVDTVSRRVWAAGRGLVPPEAVSRPVGLQAAQRAALVDAYRWLALLMRWSQDYRSPDFGSVEGSVPGVVTVEADTSGSEVRVLVEAPLP